MSKVFLKKCCLAYFEKNNSSIPVLEFILRKKSFLGTDEISLYYDGKDFYSNKLGNESNVSLSDEEVKYYRDFILKYDKYILSTEDIYKALDYFYDNKLSTSSFNFLAKTKDCYFVIDCIYTDWYGEYFKTKKECLAWLYGE